MHNGQVEAAALLLRAGADPHAPNRDGVTPLLELRRRKAAVLARRGERGDGGVFASKDEPRAAEPFGGFGGAESDDEGGRLARLRSGAARPKRLIPTNGSGPAEVTTRGHHDATARDRGGDAAAAAAAALHASFSEEALSYDEAPYGAVLEQGQPPLPPWPPRPPPPPSFGGRSMEPFSPVVAGGGSSWGEPSLSSGCSSPRY